MCVWEEDEEACFVGMAKEGLYANSLLHLSIHSKTLHLQLNVMTSLFLKGDLRS